MYQKEKIGFNLSYRYFNYQYFRHSICCYSWNPFLLV